MTCPCLFVVIFTTIGVTVFATESLVYVDRLRLDNNANSRRWGMWLIIPNLALSFLASICFILASIFHWCDYRSMQVTGILTHSVDKYGGSVCKAPSDRYGRLPSIKRNSGFCFYRYFSSNTTSGMKKSNPYMHQQQIPTQDYPNTCYQIGSTNNNQNAISYPPPPSYPAHMHHQGNGGAVNPAFQSASGLFGYSRPPSPMNHPMYPHPNVSISNYYR